MDEEENGSSRECRGAGTVNILAAGKGVVTFACAMESDVVVSVDYEAKIHQADGDKKGDEEKGDEGKGERKTGRPRHTFNFDDNLRSRIRAPPLGGNQTLLTQASP